MPPNTNDRQPDAQWTGRHCWSTHFELTNHGCVIAKVDLAGSNGSAEINGSKLILQRMRLPPYLLLRASAFDELVARLSLIPKHGLLAEFDDGESFRLGWLNFFKREWSWTDERGDPILFSRRALLGASIDYFLQQPEQSSKWPMLAVLELAAMKMSAG